jgi:hypothetical protein
MMVHTNEETAIERGIDGAHFFGYSLAHYYGFARHQPARTVVWDEFQQRRESTGFSRTAIRANREALGVKVLEATGLGSLRGAIGTTRQVTDLLRRYEAAGVDQVIFLVQAGRNRHEDVCESLDLFAREVLPSFAANREAGEAAKAARLAPAVEAALARRAPPRAAPPYEINELGEMKRANRARRTAPPEPRLRKARESADEWVRGRMHAMIVRAVRGKSDAEIETRFRARVLQQALFSALARGFNPKYAFGFLGEIEYELVRSNGSSTSTVSDLWTLRVDPNGASAQMARGQDPALKIRMPLADFVRMLAGEVPPLEPVLEGRAVMQGDLNLSSRLTEMFGGPSNL